MKKKNLLNSLTRLALAVVFMVGLSLSSFAQGSCTGFNYQAAITTDCDVVSVIWSIDGSAPETIADVEVHNGIIATVIGEDYDYSNLGADAPTLEIIIKDCNGETLASSNQTIKAVPFADIALGARYAHRAFIADSATNVFVNDLGQLVVNGTVVPGLSPSPIFQNLTVSNKQMILGTGDAAINDAETFSQQADHASLATAGGIYVGGTSYFSGTLGTHAFKINNTSYTDANLILGIADIFPLDAATMPDVNYVPSYKALNTFAEALEEEFSDLFGDVYLTKVEAAATYATIANLGALETEVAEHHDLIEDLFDIDSLGLQHAYDMGNLVEVDTLGMAIVDADGSLEDGISAIYSTILGDGENVHAIEGRDETGAHAGFIAGNQTVILSGTETNIAAGVLGATNVTNEFGALGVNVDGVEWAGYFNGNVNISDDATIGGDAIIGGGATIGGDATIDGNIDATGDLTAEGDASFGGTVLILGETTIDNNLTVTGDLSADDFLADDLVVDSILATYANVYDLRVQHNLSVGNNVDGHSATFQNAAIVDGTITNLESSNIEANQTFTNLLQVGQTHTDLSMVGTGSQFDFYKPVFFHDLVTFSNLAVDTLEVNDYLIAKEIVTEDLDADTIITEYVGVAGDVAIGGNTTIEGNTTIGGDVSLDDLNADTIVANYIDVTDISFDNMVGNINLTDTVFDTDPLPFSIVNVDLTNAIEPVADGFTAVLGGAGAYDPTIFGFGYAAAAVTGYDKSFTTTSEGLGVLGTKIYDISNPLLTEAYGLTAGDDKVFAGFFLGDVAISGKITAGGASIMAKADGPQYKTVDVDYENNPGSAAFTAILGGSSPIPATFTAFEIADAAVVGYDKEFTTDPDLGGLGVLGSRVFGIHDPLMLEAFGLADGDSKIFAGFFAGDVAIIGKLAGEQALFMGTALPTDTQYKTVDVDYTSPIATEFTSILGGSTPAGTLTTEFVSSDAAVVGYDKIFTSDPNIGGLGVLGARVYDLEPTGFLYEVFGPTGNNSLIDVDDKVFAGFFVGDVAIVGDLAVKGNLVVDGSLDATGGFVVPFVTAPTYDAFVATHDPANYSQGTLMVVFNSSLGKVFMYILNGGIWTGINSVAK